MQGLAHAPFRRPRRHAEHLGDLPETEALKIMQHDHFAVVGAQLGHRTMQSLGILAGHGAFARSRSRSATQLDRLDPLAIHPLLAAMPVDKLAVRDAMQPRGQRR